MKLKQIRNKTWQEQLQLDKTIAPNEKYKRIWVDDPNNPEQIAAWQRSQTKKVYTFPLNKEKFIHFTLAESVAQILADSTIKSQGSTFAVSTSFGVWLPVVQYNHIISKKNDTTIAPRDLKNKLKYQKMLKRGYRVPELGKEIQAIIFQTDQIPKIAHSEEVIWEGDLKIKNAKQLTSREAIQILKHTPHQIGSNDEVKYED